MTKTYVAPALTATQRDLITDAYIYQRNAAYRGAPDDLRLIVEQSSSWYDATSLTLRLRYHVRYGERWVVVERTKPLGVTVRRTTANAEAVIEARRVRVQAAIDALAAMPEAWEARRRLMAARVNWSAPDGAARLDEARAMARAVCEAWAATRP